jgi:hypothetical protein
MISFDGMDILLESEVTSSDLAGSLATALGISLRHILVVDDLERCPETSEEDVVCVTSPAQGQFTIGLSIHCRQRTLPYESALELVEQLATALGRRCLASDDDVNPYTWWLVEPGQPTRKVHLDTAALDKDRYVLAEER